MTTKTKTPTTSKDHSYITSLPTFAARGEAIAKRLEEVKANPKYQALSEEKKTRVREDLYNKYVPKSYTSFHLPVPDKATWVGATGRDTTFKAMGPNEKLSETYKDTPLENVAKDFIVGALKTYDGIALFGARVTNSAFSSIFHLNENYSHKTEEMLQSKVPEYKIAKNVQRHIENYIDAQKAKIQSDDFWLQTHPRDTMVGKLASDAGELISTLPLYGAISELGIGAKVSQSANLSVKLAASKTGQFVAKRLGSATDMFLASLVESGGSVKSAAETGVSAIALESGAAGVGKGLKIAAAPLIKKWTAHVIAEGGIPFAQDIAASAMHETEEEIAHEAQVAVGGTGEELAKLREAAIKRETENPIVAKLHAGEKVSQGSVAMQLYNKPLRNLSKAQRQQVMAHRLELIKQAAIEAPVHLPEQQLAEVTQNIKTERSGNTIFDATLKQFEAMGVEFPEAVADNKTEQIAKQTGISNVKGATKKLEKVTNVPTKSVGADLNAFHKVQREVYSYYRNSRNRKNLAEAVGAASAGNYDKLYEQLKKADGNKFQFEKPIDRLLYHYGNREHMPDGMSRSILNNIRKTKGFENVSAKEVQRQAAIFHNHIFDFVASGRAATEGNVFASTRTDGTQTVWQKQLSAEADAKRIEGAQKALRNHPRALKSFNTTVKSLQHHFEASKMMTPEQKMQYKQALRDSAENIVKHMKDKKLGGIIQ